MHTSHVVQTTALPSVRHGAQLFPDGTALFRLRTIGRAHVRRAYRAVAALYLLLPQIPMLFMGEEWNSRQPFPFFCDYEGELAEAVRKGRRAEFAHLPEFSRGGSENIPDPIAEETFTSAVLRWRDSERPEHAQWLQWYRRVLAVRRAEIVPLLNRARSAASSCPGLRTGRFAMYTGCNRNGSAWRFEIPRAMERRCGSAV